jgi:hypothetical protein
VIPRESPDNTLATRRVRVCTALRWIGVLTLLFFSVPLAVVAGFLGWRQYRILKTWPSVDAQVVRANWTRHPAQSSREPVDSYGAEFLFRYSVGGRQYESVATSGYNSVNLREVQGWLNQVPVGSHRTVRYEPDNPQVISLATDYGGLSFAAPYALARWVLITFCVGTGLIAFGRLVDGGLGAGDPSACGISRRMV